MAALIPPTITSVIVSSELLDAVLDAVEPAAAVCCGVVVVVALAAEAVVGAAVGGDKLAGEFTIVTMDSCA